MKRLLSGFLAWWAFLHLIWMASTFLLFGVLVISDDNPLQAIFEWLYDAYAFGVFQMRGWVILGFAPGCWLLNYVLTGTFRFLPWKPATWLSCKGLHSRGVRAKSYLKSEPWVLGLELHIISYDFFCVVFICVVYVCLWSRTYCAAWWGIQPDNLMKGAAQWKRLEIVFWLWRFY